MNALPKNEKKVLIKQGAYGCIFTESGAMSGKQEQPVFIEKIQKRKNTADNEKKIGDLIKSLSNYSKYFAPIESASEVKLSSNDSDELNKCEFIGSTTQAYVSNKIKYIGQHTLANFMNLYSKEEKNANSFFNVLLTSFTHLCEGLVKLGTKNIIHFDLKENNIMVKEKTNEPIIIDFGMSFQIDSMPPPETTFFVYGPDYAPWCFDICFLTFITNQIGSNWKTVKIEKIHTEKIINDFTTKNDGVNDLLNAQDKDALKNILTRQTESYINMNGQDVYNKILEKHKTWDLYSMCIIFLYLLKFIGSELIENNEIIKQFKTLLLSIVINNGTKPEELLKQMKDAFQTTNKQPVQELNENYKEIFNEENYQKRSQIIAESQMKATKKEKEFAEKL